MNKRGQALVEFVIILPIFIFMVLAIIDVGKIIYFSNVLESKVTDIISMYENEEKIDVIERNINKEVAKTKIQITEEKGYTEFEIIKKVEIITPGLNLIFNNPYEVNVKRVIYNE